MACCNGGGPGYATPLVRKPAPITPAMENLQWPCRAEAIGRCCVTCRFASGPTLLLCSAPSVCMKMLSTQKAVKITLAPLVHQGPTLHEPCMRNV